MNQNENNANPSFDKSYRSRLGKSLIWSNSKLFQLADANCSCRRPRDGELSEFHAKATRTLFVGNISREVSQEKKIFNQQC